jgi:GNAT superfamily N-acetyltransferase
MEVPMELLQIAPDAMALPSTAWSEPGPVDVTQWHRESRLRVMPLNPSHVADVLGLFLGLDPVSRHCRFHFGATDETVGTHVSRTLTSATWVAGVFAAGGLRGVAEVYETGIPGVVEVALVVDPAWRRQGLGFALMQAVKRWAEASGRHTLRMSIAPSNVPMRALARKAGAHLALMPDEITADVTVGGFAGIAAA